MRRLFVIAMAGLLAACAQQPKIQMYAGAPLPQNQVLTVVVPGELEIRSINGQPYSAANASSGLDDKELLLQPGAYQIHAFYKNGFDIAGGMSHEVVRGRTAIFNIEGKAGELWRLEFNRPKSLAEAKEFENDFPAWAVNTRTGERKDAEAGNRNVSAFSVLMGSSEVAAQATSVAPLGATAATAPQAVALTPAPAQAAALPHNDATLTTLQQMWNLLTPESRSAFLKWAQQ
ncbi:DUF2057 domain-containing protein [Pseudomonas sp. GD03721]|uniref:DUF2057 family protein n=1 Tax=Ectopseudomonas guguanensis TaxID=1198456 RepID=UPI0024419F35|nr:MULTISPECIES: DUF2057 family protein [Pseudomonas]MDH1443454.1 DUF2057 domain-containing protein [Pseudomonas sp. GD03722]WGG00608.1 DUF2057 domain-containing protein [Pseudomonas sp. GD03721]WGG04774.1 DUF2057 domain-containing protein [Pseudomonas sp. GD03919]